MEVHTSNKVNAPKEVWEDLYKKGIFYKQFKKHGFEYDYEMFGEIFNPSTSIEKLNQASTQEPPTSDKEREIDDDFLVKGVHIDVDGDHLQEIGKKGKAI
ncbi:hypothetical protein SESBI_01356 [Sesbania bispinosa]|nr:hypothetical protein SESBI_01356 [Sesbania bispinosa]